MTRRPAGADIANGIAGARLRPVRIPDDVPHPVTGRFDLDDETRQIAARDDEPAIAPLRDPKLCQSTGPKVGARSDDIKAALDASKNLNWISLYLDQSHENIAPIVHGPIGAYVVFLGWEGSGKSSVVMQLGINAVRAGLAFVYMVTELDVAEAGARIVGIQTGHSWEDAHRGRVPQLERDAALDLPGFVVLCGEDATPANLERVVSELRTENRERPIVVVWDYIQDFDFATGNEERLRIRSVSRLIRKTGKRLGIFNIGVSQTSRAGREDLRSGQALGADTTTKGAESSQLERDAYLTLALGNPQEQPDGTVLMDLSVGKGRMRKGNRVYPLSYDGRTGRARIVGEGRSAAEVRDERNSERRSKARETIKRSILDLVSKSTAPMSKAQITSKTAGNNSAIADAIKELVRDGLLEHDHAQSKYGHAPLWTPDRIRERAASE